MGGKDNQPGWVFDLNIQGVCFTGDHYAVENLDDGSAGVRVTVWNDDPDDWPPGTRHAHVWEFFKLQPDPENGGAYNTVQKRTTYAEAQARFANWAGVRPWSEFVPPPEAVTRHGVWVEDEKATELQAAAEHHGWREWTEGVPPEFVELRAGRLQLRPGRDLGLYAKPKGTKTYFLRDTDLATGIHVGEHENKLLLTAGGGEQESVTVNAGTVTGFIWTTESGEPGMANWPKGDVQPYQAKFDVSAAGADLTYGLLIIGPVFGHMGQVLGDLSGENAKIDVSPPHTGTGIKTSTYIATWPTGPDTLRFELTLIVQNTTHMSETLTLDYNSDSTMVGPWSDGGATYNEEITLAGGAAQAQAPLATLNPALEFSAGAAQAHSGGLTLQEVLTLAAAAVQAQSGGLTLQETLALAAAAAEEQTPGAVFNPTLSLAGGAAQTQAPVGVFNPALIFSGSATIAQIGQKVMDDAVSLTAGAAITQLAGLILEESLSFDASGGIVEGGTRDIPVSTSLSGSAAIANSAIATLAAALGLSASGAMTPTAEATLSALVTLSASADYATTGVLGAQVYNVFATLDASAGITTGGQLVIQVSNALSAGAGISLAAQNEITAALGLSVDAALTPSNLATLGAKLAFGAQADIAAVAQQVSSAVLALGASAAQAQQAGKVITDTLTLAVAAVLAQAGNVGGALGDVVIATLQALVANRTVQGLEVERTIEALVVSRTAQGLEVERTIESLLPKRTVKGS